MMEEIKSVVHGHDVDRLLQELNACRNALSDAEAVQQTFWNTLRMGIIVHDASTAIISSNAAAQELLGLGADSLAGRTASDALWHFTREDRTDMPAEEYPVNIVLRTRKALDNYVAGVQRRDRDCILWLLVNAAPALDRTGAVTKVLVTFVDISERKHTEERLRLLSEKDALTELPNRRFFGDILDREWRLAVRYNLPVSLVMIDIDFFKAYNDRYGHLAGDECLMRVSQMLAGALKRPTDFLARYGGEEFVLLLQNTELDGAVAIAEELRDTVEKQCIPHAESPINGCLTISLGVAKMTPKRDDQISELLLAADNALYRAKYLGKNQVVIADH